MADGITTRARTENSRVRTSADRHQRGIKMSTLAGVAGFGGRQLSKAWRAARYGKAGARHQAPRFNVKCETYFRLMQRIRSEKRVGNFEASNGKKTFPCSPSRLLFSD